MFKTKNIDLAAAIICLGHKMESMDSNKQGWIIFKNVTSEEGATFEANYINSDDCLKVDPRGFISIRTYLMNMVRSKSGKDRRDS